MSAQETVETFLLSRFRAGIPGGEVRFDHPLISSGIIDSFGLLETIAFLEDSFHVTIDPSRQDFSEFDTVNGMIAVVDRLRAAG
jgi:acyl carrier protein